MAESKPIPFVYDGTALTRMFSMQRNLIGILEKKGKFFHTNSDISINLELPPEQAFFREISGFFLEELFEAEEKIREIIDYALNQPHHTESKTCALQKDLGDEIADCTHFILELLLLSGINEDTLEKQIEEYLNEGTEELRFRNSHKPLETMFSLAQYNNIFYQRKGLANTYRDIIQGFPEERYTVYQKICAKCSHQLSDESNKLLLQLLRDIHKALRMLKKKPWRQGTSLNIKQFQSYMGEVWGTYICWLELLGFDTVVLFDTYFIKHQVVLERLTTNY